MKNKNSQLLKLWGMPIAMALFTLMGLVLAILGLGFWRLLSWISLFVPIYFMVKYGKDFFKYLGDKGK